MSVTLEIRRGSRPRTSRPVPDDPRRDRARDPRVLESQMFVMGPEVAALEAELAEYCGAARGIGCASGTDALLLPLMAPASGRATR